MKSSQSSDQSSTSDTVLTNCYNLENESNYGMSTLYCEVPLLPDSWADELKHIEAQMAMHFRVKPNQDELGFKNIDNDGQRHDINVCAESIFKDIERQAKMTSGRS